MKNIHKIFERALAKNRISHLYLFVGSQGNEKMHIAYDIATQILTFNHPQAEKIKHQIASLNYPNLIYVAKEGESIKKDQIIALQKEFEKTSLIEGSRIYIIDGIESLTQSAANSLLKFMEEPQSAQTVGLLLTDQRAAVLPTIVSRSQVILLEDEGNLTLELSLKGVDEDDIAAVSLLTSNLDEALELIENYGYKQTKVLFNKFIETLPNKENSLILLMKSNAMFLYGDKKFYQLFLNMLMRYFLDIMNYHLEQEIYFKHLKEVIEMQSRTISIKKSEKIIKDIQKLLNKIPYYINLELGLETLLFELEKSR